MYKTDFWTLWEKARVGCFERTALKHVYYLWWNRSPAQVGCMRQVLGAGALGGPGGMGWRGRWEGGSGWEIHVNPWLIHVNVWQKPLQVISLQLIKINGKKMWAFIFWQGTRTYAINVRHEWSCNSPSISYCWHSFSSVISHLLSHLQSVTDSFCPFTWCQVLMLYCTTVLFKVMNHLIANVYFVCLLFMYYFLLHSYYSTVLHSRLY